MVVDVLSRRHTLLAMLEARLFSFEYIKDLYLVNDDFREAYDLCVNLVNESFYRHDGFLFKEKRLHVPKSSIRELLVKEVREDDLMSHFRELKTYDIFHELFYWPHKRRDLHHICDNGFFLVFLNSYQVTKANYSIVNPSKMLSNLRCKVLTLLDTARVALGRDKAEMISAETIQLGLS
ncbi:hypothetical protein CR513_38710, partial [Mucuna pruriens]